MMQAYVDPGICIHGRCLCDSQVAWDWSTSSKQANKSIPASCSSYLALKAVSRHFDALHAIRLWPCCLTTKPSQLASCVNHRVCHRQPRDREQKWICVELGIQAVIRCASPCN